MYRRPGANRRRIRGVGGGLSGPDYLLNYADGTFARASAATYWDGTILRRYASGEARILADGSYYTEGARTNYCIKSNDMTHAGAPAPDQWSNARGTTPLIVGPDGVTDSAQSVTFGTAAQSLLYFHDDTIMPDSTDMAFSSFANPPAEAARYSLTDKAGVASPIAAGGLAGPGWSRATSIVRDSATGTTDPAFRLYAGGTTAGDYGFFGSMLERASFSSQLIETSGAAATRAADDMVIPQASVDPRFWTDPFEVTVTVGHANNELATWGQILATGAAGTNCLLLSTSNFISFYMNSVAKTITLSSGYSAGDEITIRVDLSTGEYRVTTPLQEVTGTHGTPVTWPVGDVSVSRTAWPFFGALSRPLSVGEV